MSVKNGRDLLIKMDMTGDGAFEFERTASRLIEMQSTDYLFQAHPS